MQKVKTFLRFLFDPKVSKWFLVRYAIGQGLAYSGFGKYISFKTPHYRLYLTKSPVAMVLFGDPKSIREEEAAIDDLLKEGDVVLDIGANIGTWSFKAAALTGKTGKVYAFEGHPHTASLIERNITLNHFSNVSVVAMALGDRAGETVFSDEAYDDVNFVNEFGEGIRVPVIRLDDFEPLKEISRVRCINLDVEGYELRVLEGGQAAVAKTDYVIFEAFEDNCKRYGHHVEDLFSWFISRGFSLLDPISHTPLNQAVAGRDKVTNVLARAPGIVS